MDVLSVSSSEEDMKLLDKDILSKLYCIDLLSKDKICKELHITAETLNYNLSYYNLKRDTTQVCVKRQKEQHQAEYRDKVSSIHIEELMQAHDFVEIYDAGQTTYSLIRR